MIVYKVEARHIDVIWPYTEPLLQKPMKRTLGEIELEDIKNWLKEESQQLWLGIDEDEQEIILAITTQIYQYPRQKHLRIHLTGAKEHTIDSWINEWIEPMERFCKENGIRYLETAGRDGWTKVLKNKGYEKYYTVLVKEIEND
ncbi:MAG: hypothetical protein CMN56_13835 [Sneathiella sp.]|jgi:hypothetical protein|uniref:hypothetical protein n=1 Tax=Sneathiella sp. TaxID=1964365 RepID=UPI000C3DBBE0|nr:hypothetical protein [Sneathiella sp.]MAZ04208.1 hypothetical protein [Sneathiella sp.]|tara:strand:- start:301 stop:732 length:432 start_codon:yes stop_codon:yes gene_type:complete